MAFGEIIPRRWRGNNKPSERSDSPFSLLQREMNDLFENFWMGSAWEPLKANSWANFSPRADIEETDKSFNVKMELPGLTDKDFKVSICDDTLTISGEKRSEHEEKHGGRVVKMERSFGSFSEVIPLNTKVDEDKVSATFKNGLLELVLPKASEAQRSVKTIPVKSGA